MRGRAKGTPKTGGRKLGVPNKNSGRVREMFATFVDDTFESFTEWIHRVAANDPKGAADLYLRACEYHIPKQARTEVTGGDGGPVVVNIVKYTGD